MERFASGGSQGSSARQRVGDTSRNRGRAAPPPGTDRAAARPLRAASCSGALPPGAGIPSRSSVAGHRRGRSPAPRPLAAAWLCGTAAVLLPDRGGPTALGLTGGLALGLLHLARRRRAARRAL